MKEDTRGRYMLDWPKEKRSKIMKKRAHERWERVTPEERKEIARKMVEARQLKRHGKQ